MLFLLIIPGLIILYLIYYKIMIIKVSKMGVHFPGIHNGNAARVSSFQYKEGKAFPFKADLYKASKAKEKLPCVIFFHGEIFDSTKPKPVEWAFYKDYGVLMANNGYAAVAFNHRSTKLGKSAAPAREDLQSLIEYLKSNEEELGIDSSRMVIWGFSGAVYAGLNWCIREKPESVKAFISYYGVFEGKEENESAVRLLNEESGENLPSILVVKAEKDTVKSSREAAEKLYEAGSQKMDIRILRHSGPHGFDGWAKTDETVEVIGQTIDYVKEILPPG